MHIQLMKTNMRYFCFVREIVYVYTAQLLHVFSILPFIEMNCETLHVKRKLNRCQVTPLKGAYTLRAERSKSFLCFYLKVFVLCMFLHESLSNVD